MLRIRLARVGKKNRPYFRIVAAEHTKPVKGKFIEILGHYDPLKKNLLVKKDQVLDWLKKGAKPSNTVAKLLAKEGLKHKAIVIKKFHKKPKTKSKKPEATKTLPQSQPVEVKKVKKPEIKQKNENEKKLEDNKKEKKVDKK